MSTGERIRNARKEKKLTQRELARRTGIAEITIRNYEAGKCTPKYDKIQKLAVALETTTDYLLGLNEKVVFDFDDIELLVSSISRFHDQAIKYFGDTKDGESDCVQAMLSLFADISRVTLTYNRLFDDVTNDFPLKDCIKRAENDASPYCIDDIVTKIYYAKEKGGDTNAP